MDVGRTGPSEASVLTSREVWFIRTPSTGNRNPNTAGSVNSTYSPACVEFARTIVRVGIRIGMSEAFTTGIGCVAFHWAALKMLPVIGFSYTTPDPTKSGKCNTTDSPASRGITGRTLNVRLAGSPATGASPKVKSDVFKNAPTGGEYANRVHGTGPRTASVLICWPVESCRMPRSGREIPALSSTRILICVRRLTLVLRGIVKI